MYLDIDLYYMKDHLQGIRCLMSRIKQHVKKIYAITIIILYKSSSFDMNLEIYKHRFYAQISI